MGICGVRGVIGRDHRRRESSDLAALCEVVPHAIRSSADIQAFWYLKMPELWYVIDSLQVIDGLLRPVRVWRFLCQERVTEPTRVKTNSSAISSCQRVH